MSNTQTEELQLQIQDLTQEVKRAVRRIDEMQKSVDLINDDRTILEDLVVSVAHLKEITITGRDKTINKVSAVVEKQTHSVVDELKSKFKRKGIEPKKKRFWLF